MGPNVSIIVAASTNNAIGLKGELPWHLSEDLKRFKAITLGKPIIMGRLTYESIGKPLPGRQNIVVTRQADYAAPGCDVVASPEGALLAAGEADEIMVIGGGEIYRQFLPSASRIYLTRVHATVDGDAFFQPLDSAGWERSEAEYRAADEQCELAFSFEIYQRR